MSIGHKTLRPVEVGSPIGSQAPKPRGSSFFPDPLSPLAKSYILVVICGGLAVFSYSLLRSMDDLRWLFLIPLMLIISSFSIKMPLVQLRGDKLAISVGDVLLFTSMFLFSPEVAAILGPVEALVTNTKVRVRRRYRQYFNVSQLVLVPFVVGHLFYKLRGAEPPLNPALVTDASVLLLQAGLCGLIYFAINTGLVATAMSVVTKQSFLEVWRRNFIWAWITHFAGAMLGAIVFLCFEALGFYALSVAIPTILLIHYAYKLNAQRIKNTQSHLEEVRELLKKQVEADKALQKAKDQLEVTVQERTRELRETNQKLISEIVERRAIEKALAAEKEGLAVTLHSIGDGVITMDTDEKILLINRVAEELTGWTKSDGTGRPLDEVFRCFDSKTGASEENPGLLALRARDIVDLVGQKVVLVAKNGTERQISYSAAPLRDNDGLITGSVLAFRDITDQIRAEEELMNADKLASLGLLAGGIAHDFNNVLATILLKSQLASRSLKNGKDPSALLGNIEEAVQKATDLTRQLLTFAKGGAPIKKSISLEKLLKECATFALSGSNLECKFQIQPHLWPVEADEGQIHQVVNNLVINAKQAMPNGGTLIISAENTELEPDSGMPELVSGPYVKVSVADNGPGIEPEHLNRLFEPYFTTKAKGNGLGLASVFSIIRRHGGAIRAESQEGQGATFTFYISASSESPCEVEPVEEELVGGSARVLVMDDEEIIRESTGALLEELGYQVDYAKNGIEAITLYEEALQADEPFKVVLLDLTIPGGMGGKETIERLREIDPGVNAVVSSGYSEDSVMANYKEYGFRGVLVKPFKFCDLCTVLEGVLKHD